MMALVSMSGGALAKELEECGLSVLVSTFVGGPEEDTRTGF